MDTLDALDLDGTLADLAAALGRLGDHRALDLRRATALGMLAHPQRVLDLAARRPAARHRARWPRSPGRRCSTGPAGTLYLHVDADRPGGPDPAAAGRWSGSAPPPWPCSGTGCNGSPGSPSDRSSTRPAPTRWTPTTHPAWMRELVMLRDRHCVFPGCTIDARACDLDHLDPYVPLDEGGPPGQTSPANLACLCRRHHRMKTFAGWAYRRVPDDPPTTETTAPPTSGRARCTAPTASPPDPAEPAARKSVENTRADRGPRLGQSVDPVVPHDGLAGVDHASPGPHPVARWS